MHITVVQKQNKRDLKRQWMQHAGITGFVFFFAKGVAWIVVAAWAVY